MDIKIPHSLLSQYLETDASPKDIAKYLTLCGPSVDRLTKQGTDFIYEIEVITNRVDCVSAFGIAREANAILPQFGFKSALKNNPYIKEITTPKAINQLPLNIQILNQSLSPRFSVVVLKNLQVKASSPQIKKWLKLSGHRSLNNLIDITNFLTLCLGQPTHIFDYDKIQGHLLKLRESRKGETVTTLDHKTHILKGKDIVIEDASGKLIDLCGIMGGLSSEVDEHTTRAILFVQTYKPENIRRTSLSTQTRTVAAQIFEKKPDPELVHPTLLEGIKLLQTETNAEIASEIIDIYPSPVEPKNLSVKISWIEKIIGIKLNKSQIEPILDKLGFKPKITKDSLTVQIPTWRNHDITIKEDIVEEIARVIGYFSLPSILPPNAPPEIRPDNPLNLEYETKIFLSHLGFTEIFNFSLISESSMNKCHLSLEHTVNLQNPLTSDFALMRRSLIPSLLQNLSDNLGKTKTPVRLFELANIYQKLENQDSLPTETPILTFLSTGDNFQKTKGVLEALLQEHHLKNIRFTPLDEESDLFQKNKTANVFSGDDYLGIIGEITPTVLNGYSINQSVIIVNLNFQTIQNLATSIPRITLPSKYIVINEEITLKTNQLIGEVIDFIKNLSPQISSIHYLSSFKDKHSFEIEFTNRQKNISQMEVDALKKTIIDKYSPR